jgi:preprotein translocase subunit SecG
MARRSSRNYRSGRSGGKMSKTMQIITWIFIAICVLVYGFMERKKVMRILKSGFR